MQNSLCSRLKVPGLDEGKAPLTIQTVNRRYQQLMKDLHPGRHYELTADMKLHLVARFCEVTSARNFFNDWWDYEAQNFGDATVNELTDADYEWASMSE